MPAPRTINRSSFSKDDKLIVEYAGLRRYKAYYMFDSVLNQGMIWVKFDCRVNELTKSFSSCCSLWLVGLESRRKKKISTYYQPGVMEPEMILSSLIKFSNRVATNSSELVILTNISTIENNEYTHLVTENSMNFNDNANFADDKG